MNPTKTAVAVVTGHGTRSVTVKELAKIKTPTATETWQPIPHVQVPEIITKMVKQNNWSLINNEMTDSPFRLTVTKDNAKLFGVCKVEIPGLVKDEDFQLAIGFRNSHDKTLALRIAVGSHVMVCSNLCMSGDIQLRRVHSIHISTIEAVTAAFEMIPDAAKRLFGWMSDLRTMQISQDAGVALLAQAVEMKALPITTFMDARASFISACKNENPTVKYGGTMWSVYQTITEQYRDRSLPQNQWLSENLNKMITEKTGMVLQ